MKKFLFSMFFMIISITTLPVPVIAKPKETIYLPILMYHQILEKDSNLGSYVITAKEFESDLQLLRKHGYTTITIKDLLDYMEGKSDPPEKPVMLTFDDGFESDYVYAFPLLKKYGMKAVFSIIGKYADLYSGNVQKHISYSHLSWDQIKEMQDSGLADFQSHTYNMHLIGNRRGAQKKNGESYEQYEKVLAEDLSHLNNAYMEHIGIKPKGFACPYGFYDNNLRKALKDSGFLIILTSNQRINRLTGDYDELLGLNRFVRSHNMDVENLIRSWEEILNVERVAK